ncbi:MAG: DUF4124 domain-containing protein [Pseudomonadota bacterium]
MQRRLPGAMIHRIWRCRQCSAAAAIAAALVAATAARAEVYRCRDDDGVVRYTDKPCSTAARPIDLPDPIVVPAGPTADLLGEAQQREDTKRAARDEADAEWIEQHAARKAEEERLRNARVTATVVEGMTPADVRRIHGDPLVVSESRSAKGVRETWSYTLEDKRRLHVTFTDGRVSSVRTRKEKK